MANKRTLKTKCPSCEVKSWNRDWDVETRKHYSGEIGSISDPEFRNDAWHYCPSCKEEFVIPKE